VRVWFRSTASTMKDAARLAAQGEPHGTTVIADEQTAGIGRNGHSWHSERGLGLYISIILRPSLPPDSLPVLTMALGLAVQSAVKDATGVECDLRWPNDLLFEGRKVAGIMVQATESALIGGVGINVNHSEFPEELRDVATSLRIATGREHLKDQILDRVLVNALEWTERLEQRGKQEIFAEFERRSSYVHSKPVEVELSGRTIEGTTAGLDANGFLRVQTAAGIETVIAGGVRERQIRIVEYNTRWPELYAAEDDRIRQALGFRAVRIEHVGSTAVTGLVAKPVIDVLLAVANSADEGAYADMLGGAGYTLRLREPEWFEHRLFKRSDPEVNLHVFSTGCEEIERILLFRDWLRTNAPDRELYAGTKQALAQRSWDSVDAYASAKSQTVREILNRAQADATKNVRP